MKNFNLPSKYMDFLKSDIGNKLYNNLMALKSKIAPFKRKFITSILVASIISILIYILIKNFWGLTAFIPSIYLYFQYKNASSEMLPDYNEFKKELTKFVLGDMCEKEQVRIDYYPRWLMTGEKFITQATKEHDMNLGIYGTIHKLKVVEKKEEKKKDQTVTKTNNLKERGHVVRFPSYANPPESKAVFRFRDDMNDLTRKLNIFDRDKRTFDLTDTELDDMYSVSVGGIKNIFIESDSNKMEWTKVITPFFEEVLKAIVAVYGETFLIFEDGYLFAWCRCKMPRYRSTEYGDLHNLYHERTTSNHYETLNLGELRPEKVVPFLSKIYLNKVLFNMISYFFTTDQVRGDIDRSLIKEELEAFVRESHTLNIDEIRKEFKSLEA
ncbi:MAG: hypothetical protein Q4E50_02310 [Tissierellia bacterium]|nr:hypothetical protein [Tissierellia bacterium]